MYLRPVDAFIIPLSCSQKSLGYHDVSPQTLHKTDIHNGIVTSYLKILHSILDSNNELLSTAIRHGCVFNLTQNKGKRARLTIQVTWLTLFK